MTYEMMKPEDFKTAVSIAADAFSHYDFFAAYVPNDRKRPRFLQNMMRTEFQVNEGRVHYLKAVENGRIAAIAVLRDPSYQMPGIKDYLRAGFWKNLLIGGYKNVAAWFDMDQKAGVPCAGLGGNTWFLHLLAVAPDIEGKGIGSHMLQDCIIPYVKEHGGDALSLYTNSEINRKFYTKNGFQEFHAQQFSYNGTTFGSWSYQMAL